MATWIDSLIWRLRELKCPKEWWNTHVYMDAFITILHIYCKPKTNIQYKYIDTYTIYNIDRHIYKYIYKIYNDTKRSHSQLHPRRVICWCVDALVPFLYPNWPTCLVPGVCSLHSLDHMVSFWPDPGVVGSGFDLTAWDKHARCIIAISNGITTAGFNWWIDTVHIRVF